MGIGNFFLNMNKRIFVLHCITIMKTITIRLNKQAEQYLKELSELTGNNQSEIVREAIRKEYQLKMFRDLREKLIPYAQKAGYYTDEDIFNDPDIS